MINRKHPVEDNLVSAELSPVKGGNSALTINLKQNLYRFAVIGVFLFHALLPQLSVADNDNNGYYSVLCTIHGYQQVWVDLAGEQEKNTIDCPECLPHNLSTDNFSILSTDKFSLDNLTQAAYLSDSTKNLFAKQNVNYSLIRAPPIYS